MIPKAIDLLHRITPAVDFSWFLGLALLVGGCATQRPLQRQDWNHQEDVEVLLDSRRKALGLDFLYLADPEGLLVAAADGSVVHKQLLI